jgi:hypothetical protein
MFALHRCNPYCLQHNFPVASMMIELPKIAKAISICIPPCGQSARRTNGDVLVPLVILMVPLFTI